MPENKKETPIYEYPIWLQDFIETYRWNDDIKEFDTNEPEPLSFQIFGIDFGQGQSVGVETVVILDKNNEIIEIKQTD